MLTLPIPIGAIVVCAVVDAMILEDDVVVTAGDFTVFDVFIVEVSAFMEVSVVVGVVEVLVVVGVVKVSVVAGVVVSIFVIGVIMVVGVDVIVRVLCVDVEGIIFAEENGVVDSIVVDGVSLAFVIVSVVLWLHVERGVDVAIAGTELLVLGMVDSTSVGVLCVGRVVVDVVFVDLVVVRPVKI